jgi:N-acetyl-anhydromuramyl-L-alanine amidase AmpD
MDAQHARLRTASARPHTLKAALCLALLMMAIGLVGSGSMDARAASSQTGEIAAGFATSARHWSVPQQILMAIGYVESHWEQRGGEPSLDQGYGIMHVTDRADGTLNRAVTLTGLSADAIRRFPQANIEAGAALLRDISQQLHQTKRSVANLADWYPVVAAYSGATDPYVSDSYARQVFQVVREGAQATLRSGEEVVLLPSGSAELQAPLAGAPASQDYPPALWVPANPNNYLAGRPYPPLNTIIIHDTEGSYASAISWFQNPSSGVSTHYIIRSSDGQVTQAVRNADTAYQAGNWDYNVRAIGIEHEGYQSQQGWYTEAMYQSSAALVRYLTDHYSIKKDRAHIIGHYQVPNQSHTDPGPYWNWTHYMSLVRRDTERAALVDNTDPGFAPTPAQVDPQHYWWTYSGGYNGSNTYDTTSVTYQSSSVNSAVWTAYLQNTGYYDLYAFIPYVDNATPDTSSAKYLVYAADGTHTSVTSQKAITDVGSGSWANLGKYYFTGGQNARVSLSDWTGETGKNVWFDAIMWIPSATNQPPPTPQATDTPGATATYTSVPVASPTAAATWTPGPCGMRFSDLPDNHWAYNYVAYLFCDGVISGYSDGTFRPNDGSTRGQFAKMLVLSMGWYPYDPVQADFLDVQPGSTYYTYIESAYAHGAIDGYADGRFRPNYQVTRAQAAKMLVLGKGWPLLTPQTPTFSDVPASSWAYSFVETAVSHGIVDGFSDNTFRPGLAISRAQLAKVVMLTMRAAGPAGRASLGLPAATPTDTIATKVPPSELP